MVLRSYLWSELKKNLKSTCTCKLHLHVNEGLLLKRAIFFLCLRPLNIIWIPEFTMQIKMVKYGRANR